jgi:hypothetical protein
MYLPFAIHRKDLNYSAEWQADCERRKNDVEWGGLTEMAGT